MLREAELHLQASQSLQITRPQVTNNAGMPSDPESVTRRLRVVEDCSDGLASCESGQCAQDVVQCNNDGESASEGLPSPRIQLRKVPGEFSFSRMEIEKECQLHAAGLRNVTDLVLCADTV
eukprot:1157793-Pelagomonas_calceolata.AAC.1